MVDALDLGSSVERRAGSNPVTRICNRLLQQCLLTKRDYTEKVTSGMRILKTHTRVISSVGWNARLITEKALVQVQYDPSIKTKGCINTFSVYKITNKINGKVYIGFTSYSIEKRFREHINKSKYESNVIRPLYVAMRKYGVEQFFIDLIETVEARQEACRREKFWIKHYNSYGEGGYNATKGGDDGSSKSKCVFKISTEDFSILEKYESTHEAGKSINKPNAKISKACSEQSTGIAYGYFWIYEEDFDNLKISLEDYLIQKYQINGKNKCVLQINPLNGEVIKRYLSISDASKSTGIPYKRIHRVCSGERNKCKGFIWKYY